MIGAIDERHFDVDHREAREIAGGHDRIEPFFDARNELLRHNATDDPILELESLALLLRLGDDLHPRELARAPRLLLVRIVDGRRARDRLAIGDLRRAYVDLDAVRTLQNIDLDVEMKLAH